MSYVSILKNIPEFLSQPAGIAAIASVGIHGAIAFILPLMPVDSTKSNQTTSPASVGIMELSQAEQNRLPQNKSPQISALPQIPLQPTVPLPNFGSLPTPLPQLPPNPDSTKVILPPLPRASANPSISSLPVLPQPSFNSSFNAKASSSGSYRRFNQKINLGQPAPLVSRRSAPRRQTSSPVANIPSIQAEPIPPELTRVPPPPPLPPMTDPGLGIGNSVAIGNRVPVNLPRVVNPKDFVAPTSRNIPKPGDKLTFAGQSLQQWGNQSSGNRRIELPNQQPSNGNIITAPQNTSTLTLAKQFEEVRGRYSNLETKEPISDVVRSKKGQEGKTEGTLVIDADGKADYLKFVDRSVSSDLKKATRDYFRNYFKENPIRKNGKAKVYAFTLDFKPNVVNSVEFSKPQETLVDRLRSAKKDEVQINQKPSGKKPENLSRSSAPIKIDAQPARNAVVVPTVTSTAPVKPKPQVQIRTKPTSGNNAKPPLEVRLRNSQEVPPVPSIPSIPKPQARVNVKEPAPQATSKPSLANRLRNGKDESEDDSKETNASKKLIQRLRKIQDRREKNN